MIFAPRPRRGRLEPAILGLIFVGLSLALILTDALWRWDQLLFDAHLKFWTRPAPDDIVIVGVDEVSLSTLGRWPWPRRIHADLLDRLVADNARVIGLDIIFSERDTQDPDNDSALARALFESERSVLPVFMEPTRLGGPLIEQLPIPPLTVAARALGHVHVELDRDGIARSVFLREGLGAARWPTLGLAMLQVAEPGRWDDLPGVRRGQSEPATSRVWVRDNRVWIPFSGPPGTFRRISYAQALAGEFVPGTFRDKFVLIGMTATGTGDSLPTPVSGNLQPMPGVEFNANVLEALRRGFTIEPLPLGWRGALSVLLALLPALLYPRTSPRGSLVAAVLLLGGCVVVSSGLLFLHQIWFPPAVALLVVTLSYPLWSWRRLELTVRYLDRELDRLQGEQASLPRAREHRLADALRFLALVLPIQAWLVKSRTGEEAHNWKGSPPPPPPATLASGEWLHADGYSWGACQNVGTSSPRAVVGIRWSDSVPADDRIRYLLSALLVTPEAASPPPKTTLELVEARIEQVQAATERLGTMRRIIDDSLQHMADGVVVADGFGQIVLANQNAALYLSGDEKSSIVNRPLLGLLTSLENYPSEELHNGLREAMLERHAVQMDARHRDGRDLLIQMAPLEGPPEAPGGLIVNLSDISMLKDIERRRAEMLGFLSHDLRSPLVSILALVELAENKRSSEDLRDLLHRAQAYTERTLQLAEQFLELTRAESQERGRWQAIDLASVAIHAFDQTWSQAQSRQIHLVQRFQVEAAWIRGERDLLERAILNLLTNAIKFSPSGSTVELVLDRVGDQFRCCVIDQGRGIAEEDRPKLFRRFQRIGGGGPHGVGLGLAFVKVVADRHGGSVTVESAPDEGARFCIVLPSNLSPDDAEAL